MSTHNLDKIFKPGSVAIIGASEKQGSIGFSFLKNVGEEEYQGKIFENRDVRMSRMETLVKK